MASKGVNKCIFVGTIGRDPEIKTTNGGMTIANFSIAITERMKIKDEWREDTQWVNIVAYGQTAKVCGDYLAKGSQVFIEGRLTTRKWEDKQKNTRYTTEVVVNNIVFMGGKGGGGKEEKPKRNATLPDSGFDPNEEVPF